MKHKTSKEAAEAPVVTEAASPEPEDNRGRPSGFKPEFIAIAKSLCERGFTDEEIADTFSVTTRTLYRWRAKYPDFSQAMSAGKDTPDDRVERSLYLRAIGYTYEAEKLTKSGEVVTYKVHVPPDPVAQKFWLMNRRSDKWRERKEVEIGRPGDFSSMAHDELLASLREDIVELGPELLKALPSPDKSKGTNRVKGNDTEH